MSEPVPLSPAQAPRIPWWLWFNVLSLDAPLVAILWQWALAQNHQVKLLPGCYTALGLAVWLIYITDRTLDGFNMGAKALSARHHFYRKYRWVFALGVAPIGAAFLFWTSLTDIPSGILWRGLGLGFLVSLYLLYFAARANRVLYTTGIFLAYAAAGVALYLVHLPDPLRVIVWIVLGAFCFASLGRGPDSGIRVLPKELVCGYLFAVGCSLSVQFYTFGSPLSAFFAVETLLLAVLCTLNGIAVACYERAQDAEQDPHAITQTWPAIIRMYPLLLASLAGAAVTILVRLGRHGAPPREMVWFMVAILLSTTLLGTLHAFAKRISPELAHVLADFALVTPALFFLIQ